MSNIPENLRYTKDHEWLAVEDGTATLGITDYAQSSLGDVVYIDMPRVGDKFASHEAFGSVESVKAVSEIFVPVAGEITEVNDGLNDTPEVVNNDTDVVHPFERHMSSPPHFNSHSCSAALWNFQVRVGPAMTLR